MAQPSGVVANVVVSPFVDAGCRAEAAEVSACDWGVTEVLGGDICVVVQVSVGLLEQRQRRCGGRVSQGRGGSFRRTRIPLGG